MEEFLVVSAIAILENFAQIPSLVEVLWELQSDQVLLPYTSSPLLQVCIPALVILGLLSVNADKAIIVLGEEIAVMFSKKIADAVTDTSLFAELGYMKISAEGLVKGANGLALDVTNAANFLKNDILLSFLDYLTGSNVDIELSIAIMNCFWTLTNHSTIKKELLDEPEIFEAIIQHLENAIPAAKCVLLKCKGLNEGNYSCTLLTIIIPIVA